MTCSFDGSLRVWNLKSGKQIGDNWRDGPSWSGVSTIALSPDGKKVVSGSEDGGVRLWDIDTGKVIGKWLGHTDGVLDVCWSRDGRRVLSGSHDGTARQWDAENGETILGPMKTGHGRVFAAVYSPDMTMFATGGYELPPLNIQDFKCPIRIWDTKTGELVATLKGHASEYGQVSCLAWTPDGKTLISGSFDFSIRTWSTTTWKQNALLDGHTLPVQSIAISPNGRILASASYDKTARLWNLEDNQPISSPLHHADSHGVLAVSFSADGKLLATGCGKNVYTWDISAIVKEAGLDELLLDQRDKSLFYFCLFLIPISVLCRADATRRPVRPFDFSADATPRPVRKPIKVPQRQVLQGFFDGLPDRAHVSARHRLHPRSWASHVSTLSGQLSSLFRPDAHDTSSRPRPFHWVRNRLSARPSNADIELHKHRSTVVDVPYAKGKRRDASAREKRRRIPLKSKKPAASASRPPNSNTAQ
ncbi:quinon protein alcohol dehydrogenase-like superfamily [Suillus placidus]|uniref:Quinon protein alcohol dehydrogenase-like superfamily n=1 Tax=Suillus placidus TaxID=48579 RepID=A0A9P6ZUT4_9AGAM|nr:quinon protein alcohol dehydrogenase-like superfamily [Suillus placidus]